MRPALALAVVSLVWALVAPSAALAAHAWSISLSTSTITQHVATGVGVTVSNLSTNDGGGDSTGCLVVTIPAGTEVTGAAIDSVSGGYLWTASVTGTGPTVVTLNAVDDHERLRGDPQFSVLQATITVEGLTVGQADWSAIEYEHWDCTGVQAPTETLAMSVVAGANTPPVAGDDGYGITAGSTLTEPAPGVLADDTDADGDPLTAVLLDDVDHGSLTLDPDGGFTYTPDPGWTGTDTFTYQATDGSDLSAPATVTIDVTNTAPTADDDAFVVAKNGVLSVSAASGVLVGDTDPDPGQSLVAALVDDVDHGTLDLDPDGGFTYTPTPGYAGPDSFTYRASDGIATSGVATVSITVSNHDPVAVADTYSTHLGVPLVVSAPGVLDNDGDPNGDALTASLISTTSNGILLFPGDGSFTYLPGLLFTGTDTFTYQAFDGSRSSSTVTVTIGVTNGAPVAVDDAASGSHDRQLTGGVLDNDDDPDDDPLFAMFETDVTQGTLVLDPDGTWTYDPPTGWTGTETFTYRATDGAATSSPATVTLTVTNAPPVAADGTASVHHRDTLVVGAPGVLTGATDGDGDGLTVTLDTDASHGTLSLAADGSYSYTPHSGWLGTDTFTFTVSDGLAASPPATVSITVTDTAPVGTDDWATTHHGTTLVVPAPGLLGNDTDADGDLLVASLIVSTLPGTLDLDADGAWSYAPTPGWTGSASFTYEVFDGVLWSDPVTVTVEVTDTAPAPVDDEWTVLHDRSLVVPAPGVLADDLDADGDPLTATLVVGPAHGAATIAGDGALLYVPDPGWIGTDVLTYRASDGAMGTDATVTIEVLDTAPIALPDAYAGVQDDPVSVAAGGGVLANDLDVDGDALAATVVTPPAHGTLSLAASGAFVYTPDPGWWGIDTFTYTADDGVLTSTPAFVTLTIAAAPPPPTPTPTPAPTATPTATPSPTGTPAPTATRSTEPTPVPPTAAPTDPTTPSPSATPAATPSPTPTASPSATSAPSDPPPAGPPDDGGLGAGERWSIGGQAGGAGTEMPISNLAAATLGIFGRAFDWLVPGALTAVPGLLLLLALVAQTAGALAWLPIVRRKIGGFDLAPGTRRGRAAR